MAKYHVNPNTGKISQCTAQPGNCPFGGDEIHRNSIEEAQQLADELNSQHIQQSKPAKKLTRSQLFRDAKVGSISLEMTERYGEKPPENFQKIRKVVRAVSNDLHLENMDGNGVSRLTIPRASLVEYTDNSLTIYAPGYREPTEQEKAILARWDEITSTDKYKEQAMADIYSDGSTTYYQEKYFFQKNNAEYLTGFNEQRGMQLDFNRRSDGDPKFIRDATVKGQPILKYIVHRQ